MHERDDRSAITGPGAGLSREEATLLNWFNEEEEEEGRSHSREQSQSSGFGERRKEGDTRDHVAGEGDRQCLLHRPLTQLSTRLHRVIADHPLLGVSRPGT